MAENKKTLQEIAEGELMLFQIRIFLFLILIAVSFFVGGIIACVFNGDLKQIGGILRDTILAAFVYRYLERKIFRYFHPYHAEILWGCVKKPKSKWWRWFEF